VMRESIERWGRYKAYSIIEYINYKYRKIVSIRNFLTKNWYTPHHLFALESFQELYIRIWCFV
jgi:hypothetical protein